MLRIRRYRPAHQNAVKELHVAGLEQMAADVGPGPWDEDLNDIQKHYLADRGEFLVGVCHGKVVAMGALRKVSTTRGEIKRIRVHPDYQKRGFGEAILKELEKVAARLGYAELCLDTTAAQIPAQRLFEKHGFVEVRRRRFRGLDILYYEKRLDEKTR